jgi:hypothetical protein
MELQRIELAEKTDTPSYGPLRYPRCSRSGDMTVRNLYFHFPGDGMAVGADPLEVIPPDGGRSDYAWITLIVYCAGCDREVDLYFRDGQTKLGHKTSVARAFWGNLP